MNINEYADISKNIEVPETVINRFEETMNVIKSEEPKKGINRKVWKLSALDIVTKVAAVIIAVAIFTLAGVSTKAFLSNRLRIKNTPDEEVITLYENIFKDYTGMFSRELTEDELLLENECYDKYVNSQESPKEQITIIESKAEYKGKGVAYCKEDGIIYLPDKKLDEEQMLECIEFAQFSLYIDYERYRAATDPNYYLNDLWALSSKEVEEIYLAYFGACTDTALFSRELTTSESIMLRNYRKLYKYSDKKPEKLISVISDETEYTGSGVAFCKTSCCFYIPDSELTEEEVLEILDWEIKAEYSLVRLDEEIEDGLRTERPFIEPVHRNRIITIDSLMEADEDIVELPWVKAYSAVIEKEFDETKALWPEDASSYYANVCFIFLNDDDIPEMLFKMSITDFDYDDRCNYRDIIYTYKNGEAVKIDANESELRDLYNDNGKFKYVERKGMVYLDSYSEQPLVTLEVGDDEEDIPADSLTRVDVWNSDFSSCVQSKSNIYIEHRIIDKTDLNGMRAWDNASFVEEYYINVTGVNTESIPNVVYGNKVSKEEYERANEALWQGEEYITLEVSDFDKIYIEDNVVESLAKVYAK